MKGKQKNLTLSNKDTQQIQGQTQRYTFRNKFTGQ